jgi:hypothetical protein
MIIALSKISYQSYFLEDFLEKLDEKYVCKILSHDLEEDDLLSKGVFTHCVIIRNLEHIEGEQIIFIDTDMFDQCSNLLKEFTNIRVFLKLDEIKNERLNDLREKNIFQIITDTLPDEIDDSINDINYRYFIQIFNYIEPKKLITVEDLNCDLIYFRDKDYKPTSLFKILSQNFRTYEIITNDLNCFSKVPEFKMAIIDSDLPHLIHSVIKSSLNTILLNKNDRIFSPLRLISFQQNQINFLDSESSVFSIRSFFMSIKDSISKQTYNLNDKVLEDNIDYFDTDKIGIYKYDKHTLGLSWDYKSTLQNHKPDYKIIGAKISKRSLYLYLSLIKEHNNYYDSIESIFFKLQITDSTRKFDREFMDYFINTKLLSKFIEFFFSAINNYTHFNSKQTASTVLSKISNLILLKKLLYNKSYDIEFLTFDRLFKISQKQYHDYKNFYDILSTIDINKDIFNPISNKPFFSDIFINFFLNILLQNKVSLFNEFFKLSIDKKPLYKHSLIILKLLNVLGFKIQITNESKTGYKSVENNFLQTQLFNVSYIFLICSVDKNISLKYFYKLYYDLINSSTISVKDLNYLYSEKHISIVINNDLNEFITQLIYNEYPNDELPEIKFSKNKPSIFWKVTNS